MKPTVIWINLLLIVCTNICLAEDALQLVPSFNSCSVYLKTQNPTGQYQLQYRLADQTQWINGLDLVQSKNNPTLRCSILGLAENCIYDVKITGISEVYQQSFTTWSANIPIARTITLDTSPVTISEQGTASGWIRYVAPDGLISKTNASSAIQIENAKYVILDGIKVQGGQNYSIHVKNSAYIRILNCDLSQWGRTGKQDLTRNGHYVDKNKKVINYDAGIYINQSLGVVVERCYIHDPNGTANSWAYAHPSGPCAIYMHALGQTVIRYNDIIGSDQHRWNDAIEGNRNGFVDGGFCRDADIYGNMILLGNDDAIELDGGQMNIRVWGNHFSNSLCGVSTAPSIYGPTYIYNNLFINFGDENGLAGNAIKNGYRFAGQGAIYLFNNTFKAKSCMNNFGKSDARRNYITTRNNVFTYSNLFSGGSLILEQNDFNHDMIWCNDSRLQKDTIQNLADNSLEKNGLFTPPHWVDSEAGNYQLQSGTSGSNNAVAITGICSDGDSMGIKGMLPYRPTPMTLSRSNITLKNHTPEKISINLPQGSQPFTVLKNSAFDWFNVTPMHGKLKTDQPATLTITLTDDALTRNKQLKGCFQIKLANGLSRPVTVNAGHRIVDIPKPNDQHVVCIIEAETGKAKQGLNIISDPAASGNKAIALPYAIDKALDIKQAITYSFEIPKDGKYFLAVRAKAYKPVAIHNSIYFSLDGSQHKREEFWSTGNWFWCGIRSFDPKQRTWFKAVTLKEGPHAISITPRESIELDCFIVVTDPRILFSNGMTTMQR